MKIGGRLNVTIKDYEGGQAMVSYIFESCWNGMQKYEKWYNEAKEYDNIKKLGIMKTENYLADWTETEIKNRFLTSGMSIYREAGTIEYMDRFLNWVLMVSPKQFFIKTFIERIALEVQS